MIADAAATPAAPGVPPRWDTRYEWRILLLLGIGFGLVGLDRWILPPLFSAMGPDLHVDYAGLGSAVGVLALAWGLSAALIGHLADRFGRRRVLLPMLVLFSLTSALTGLVSGLGGLLVVRALMGVFEGGYLSASIAAAADASHPRRRGLAQGLLLSAFSLFGLGLGPIVATQLLAATGTWRLVFAIVALPGIALALILRPVMRETRAVSTTPHRWDDVLRSRNVRIATIALLGAMSCIFVLGALGPSYLVDHLHLPPQQMGWVMSALGFGGFLGAVGLPALSDRVGRRGTLAASFAGSIVALAVFVRIGPAPEPLFAALFVVAFFSLGALALITGPIASEAVPTALIGSAVGLISGAGEVFGGGIAPAIAGGIAASYGIASVFQVSFAGLAVGAAASLMLKETAPRLER